MNFTVDPPELHAASKKFYQLAEEYTSVYNRLFNAAQTMGSAWDAADNLAFVDQINGFCQELKDMTAHLQQAAQALDQQATNYETVRDENTSGVRKLSN